MTVPGSLRTTSRSRILWVPKTPFTGWAVVSHQWPRSVVIGGHGAATALSELPAAHRRVDMLARKQASKNAKVLALRQQNRWCCTARVAPPRLVLVGLRRALGVDPAATQAVPTLVAVAEEGGRSCLRVRGVGHGDLSWWWAA